MNPSKEKTKMEHLNIDYRINNYEEVLVGYTKEEAILEATRCLDCKHKPCTIGCPVNIRIPEFIQEIVNDNLLKAYEILRSTSTLSAVCGRICAQEIQCEGVCVRGIKGEPVAIGALERYVADWYYKNYETKVEMQSPKNKKVAIVGCGPSGISCANELATMGYDVTIYDSYHKAGGVLAYGIPEFRLPKTVLERIISDLKKLNVKIELNTQINSSDELLQKGYDAVYLSNGCTIPKLMGIEGENLNNVYNSEEYLRIIDKIKPKPTDKIAIIGGGNVAMDVSRTAIRQGFKDVTILYRRAMEQLPARQDELDEAVEEGVKLMLLTNPVKLIGENGKVKSIECVKMQLGEKDESGRSSVVEIPNSNVIIDFDYVVQSIGSKPDKNLAINSNVAVNKKDCIVVDDNMRTNVKFVYSGGDAIIGASTVVNAMGNGKIAAKSINEDLN